MQTLSDTPKSVSLDTLQAQIAQQTLRIRRKQTKLALQQWQAARLIETL